MSPWELSHALGKALGMPDGTYKLVLTLEAGELPKVDIYCYAFLPDGRMDIVRRMDGVTAVDEIRRLHFQLRLEPFED